jgi:hypothetical protein
MFFKGPLHPARALHPAALATTLLVIGCGETQPHSTKGIDAPELPDAGTEADAGEGYELWPESYSYSWGNGNLLGLDVHFSPEHERYIVNHARRCMTGEAQLTPVAREIREARLSDADAETLRASLESPSGEGFVGQDDRFSRFYEWMTEPSSMTLTHVFGTQGGVLTFKDAPAVADEGCEAYAGRQELGVRVAVGLTFSFGSPEGLSAFRTQNAGMTLEDILRHGPTSIPVEPGDTQGLTEMRVVMARMGGPLGIDFPYVHARCGAHDLRGCAALIDELDAYAKEYLTNFPAPSAADTGEWAATRVDGIAMSAADLPEDGAEL